MFSSSKGQEPLTLVLVVAIMVAVITSVYLWGAPLIQKNKDVVALQTAEKFMLSLNDKIKYIADNGGRDQVVIGDGTLRFGDDKITLTLDTEGTIYAEGGSVSLTDGDCTDEGEWGSDPPQALCVQSQKLGNTYSTTFSLSYRTLDAGGKSYKISLEGSPASGGKDNVIVIENIGSVMEGSVRGGNLIRTRITIRIV